MVTSLPRGMRCLCFLRQTMNNQTETILLIFQNIELTPEISAQSALEFCPIHCPNGRLGQDLGFGRFAFALKLPELLNRNLAAVRAKLGQTSCFPNGPQIWCPIGQ